MFYFEDSCSFSDGGDTGMDCVGSCIAFYWVVIMVSVCREADSGGLPAGTYELIKLLVEVGFSLALL